MTFNALTHRWEGNENSLGVFDFPPPLPTPTPNSHHHHQKTSSSASYLSIHQSQAVPPPSPPRPALIAPMSVASTQNIQVVGGMVFDPVKMCWLKFKPSDHPKHEANLKSPSVTDNDDDEDPFAGIDDLKDVNSGANKRTPGGASGRGTGGVGGDEWLVGEEFDLGPEFIRRQKEEEMNWRRRCEAWFPSFGDEGPRFETQDWRWRIREIADVSRID